MNTKYQTGLKWGKTCVYASGFRDLVTASVLGARTHWNGINQKDKINIILSRIIHMY